MINNDVIPIILGGGNDISYAVYKAYASLNKFITFTSIDSKFDIGLKEDFLSSESYLGKIISHSPSFLFQFINIGYQTYYIMKKGFFIFDYFRRNKKKIKRNFKS